MICIILLSNIDFEESIAKYMKLSKKKDVEKVRQDVSEDVYQMRKKYHQVCFYLTIIQGYDLCRRANEQQITNIEITNIVYFYRTWPKYLNFTIQKNVFKLFEFKVNKQILLKKTVYEYTFNIGCFLGVYGS